MVLNEIKKNVNGVTRDGFECLKYGLQWLHLFCPRIQSLQHHNIKGRKKESYVDFIISLCCLHDLYAW